MGLINLQTNLKSLKYGKDKLGGGSSGQPYIQKSPSDSEPNQFGVGDNDFLIRGGVQAPVRAAQDVVRLTKYMFDTKSLSGLFFIAKQNLLSRIAPKTQASKGAAYLFGVANEGVYTPLSTLAQAGVGFTGTHLNKQGIDPTGLLGPLSIKKYEDVIFQQSRGEVGLGSFLVDIALGSTSGAAIANNRLAGLTNAIYVKNGELRNFAGQKGYSLNVGDNIIEYGGGPGSILGIGKTKIRFQTNRIRTINFQKTSAKNSFSVLSQKQISQQESNPNSEILGDFRKKLTLKPKTFISLSPNYKTKNIEQRVNLGNPGKKGDVSNYTLGKRNPQTGENIGPTDRITAFPIYKSSVRAGGNALKIHNDLCKFRIAIIDPNDPSQKFFLHFRAFINSFSDGYSADWSGQKYMGRAEKLYKYGGFDRDVSVSFTVVAQSKEELIPMYKKLNFLASSLSPTYTKEGGYMAGNLSQMTIGGYLYEQPGFIESVDYDIPNDTPWEIGVSPSDDAGDGSEFVFEDSTVKELPHRIEVSLKFKPIHQFRPAIMDISNAENNTNPDRRKMTDLATYGKERYIAIADGGIGKSSKNNYDSNPGPPPPPPPNPPSVSDKKKDNLSIKNSNGNTGNVSVTSAITGESVATVANGGASQNANFIANSIAYNQG